MEELGSKDVLFLMNILTLLSDLITCKHGHKFLENRHVLNNIFNNSDPLFASTCGIGMFYFITKLHDQTLCIDLFKVP